MKTSLKFALLLAALATPLVAAAEVFGLSLSAIAAGGWAFGAFFVTGLVALIAADYGPRHTLRLPIMATSKAPGGDIHHSTHVGYERPLAA